MFGPAAAFFSAALFVSGSKHFVGGSELERGGALGQAEKYLWPQNKGGNTRAFRAALGYCALKSSADETNKKNLSVTMPPCLFPFLFFWFSLLIYFLFLPFSLFIETYIWESSIPPASSFPLLPFFVLAPRVAKLIFFLASNNF